MSRSMIEQALWWIFRIVSKIMAGTRGHGMVHEVMVGHSRSWKGT